MPSERDIKRQNEELNEQRNLFGDINQLISDGMTMLQNGAAGARDYFNEISDAMDDTKGNTKGANDELSKTQRIIVAATKKTRDLGNALVNAAKTVANTMTSAFGDIADILQNILSLSIVGTFTALFTSIITQFQYEFKQVVNELGLGFKAVGTEADNVNQNFEQLRYNIVRSGLEFKDVVGSSRLLADNFGVGMSTSSELAFKI